ncbi:MAG: hypothetical protein IT543_05525 [Tabrizicola sp.]|mgnify:CR=1 FL=1|jgi:hypothetical protein|nr:hypothetical protein [Tabrizicola sp.]MCC6518291.1 hypothetical protein [Tabrizicola sp.]
MNPLTEYQRALDTVSKAVLAGDFETFVVQIDLPYLVHHETARHLITRAEDLRATFETLSQGLAKRGVTHYERIARTAEFAARDRIEGLHYTHMIANGAHIAYPHASCETIVNRGDRWLFSEAHYQLKSGWPVDDATMFSTRAAPVPGRGLP